MKITLCGSAKFEPLFHEWNERLTLAGHIVYGLAVYPSNKNGDKNWYTTAQKKVLDRAHKGKIMNSEAVLVLNSNDYIGSSTYSEIMYAMEIGRLIYLAFNYNGLGSYHMLKQKIEAYAGFRTMCPYKGCSDPVLNKPPCALCYE